jgi:hypothetical protein
MSNIPIKNPYDPDGRSWRSLHKISGQVSHADYLFFKQLYPSDGSINAVVATLWKNLIDELREYSSKSALEPAWMLESPTYDLIKSILQRRAVGEFAGQKGSRDVARRIGRVHKNHGASTKQRAKSSSRVKKREHREEGENATGA